MPSFYFDLRTADGVEHNDIPIEYDSMEAAYLSVCEAIPTIMAELVRDRRDPVGCVFEIRGAAGEPLMEVPFTERVTRKREKRSVAGRSPARDHGHAASPVSPPVKEHARAASFGADEAMKASHAPDQGLVHRAPVKEAEAILLSVEKQRRELEKRMQTMRELDRSALSRSFEALARSRKLLQTAVSPIPGHGLRR